MCISKGRCDECDETTYACDSGRGIGGLHHNRGNDLPAALAAEQLLRANGKHYNYFLDGKPYVIGVNAESRSGKFYYCRQIESMTDYKVTETTTVENTEAARRLAWLLSEYQHDGEPVLTYAAIGVLVHRNYDDQKVWVRHEQYLFSVMDGLESKVNELWEEAANKLPVSSRVTRDDRQGLRSGSLFVQLLDSSGQPIEGVFTATIEGPAVFDEDDEPTGQSAGPNWREPPCIGMQRVPARSISRSDTSPWDWMRPSPRRK